MTETHAEIIEENGRKFAKLPLEEFERLRARAAAHPWPPEPDPRYGGFFDNLSVEELTRRQGVKGGIKLADWKWPFGPQDWEGFEEWLEETRREQGKGA